jgi:hypothetical protein
MKRNELKNKIRESALNEMPDVFEQINLNQIVIEPEEKISFYSRSQFKWAISAFVFVLLAFFTFQLFFQTPSSQPFESDIELLAFQAVSAESFIEYGESELETLSYTMPYQDSVINISDASDVEDYLGDMSQMIELGELLINQEDQIQYQELNSDREGYMYHVRFSAVNLLGETIQYDLYFNEEEDEVEGLMVQGDDSYIFLQTQQYLRLHISDDAFIEAEYDATISIHRFNFRYIKQQSEVFSTHIEMILENSNYRANFEYDNKRGKVISMQMSRNQDASMDVDYDVEDNAKRFNGRFNVTVENNQETGLPIYRFKFNDESEAEVEKPGNQNPGNNNSDTPGQGPRN